MFKVSLINPPERILVGIFKYWLPFPLLYLAAYLEDNGIGVDIIDVKTDKSYFDTFTSRMRDYYNLILKRQNTIKNALYSFTQNKIIEETIASHPNLIGITCMTIEYNSVMRIASILKERLGVPIVVGGIHPSLYPEQFIYQDSPVDFVVIGEGEETLAKLARYLEAGRTTYQDIDGIAYLKEGRCHLNQTRALKDDFSISPINIYKKLDMQFYTRPNPCVTRFVRISGTQIFTSRGCPYGCTFCSNSLIWKMNRNYKPVRYRPVQSVIEEIKFLRDNYRIDGFYIMDDTFCIESKYVEEFCSELKNAAINLAWGMETRSGLVDESLFKKMKRAGLIQIDVGVESGSDEMLEEIKKGFMVKDTLDMFSLAHKYKIRTLANVLVNLPNETLQQLQETINILERIRPSSGGIAVTVPLPKTELFDKYVGPKMNSDREVVELIGRQSNYSKITDDRFRLCKYNIDFEELITRLVFKHFLFVDLQLGSWYWKVFLKSKKKLEYILTIIQGFLNITEKAVTITVYLFKKRIARRKNNQKDEMELLKI